MKQCFKCKEEKELSEFYKHPQMADGHVNKCRECNKRDVRDNRADKVEYYRAYDKKRVKDDPRVLARIKRYAASPEGKASGSRAKKAWGVRNSIKKGASTIVTNAVRDGRLFKPDTCEECGAIPSRLHGHHNDYAFALVVRWLCPLCHKRWHDENGPGLSG